MNDPSEKNLQSTVRRCLLARACALGVMPALAAWSPAVQAAAARVIKQIPVSGEAIAPVGMGTWITFNIGRDATVRAQRAEVLRAFLLPVAE